MYTQNPILVRKFMHQYNMFLVGLMKVQRDNLDIFRPLETFETKLF